MTSSLAHKLAILITICLCMVVSNLNALDLKEWDSFRLKAKDIVVNQQQEIIGLTDDGRTFKLDMDTRSVSRLPGSFYSILANREAGTLAITRQGNIFKLGGKRWKKILTDIKGRNFSLGHSYLFSLDENKLNKYSLGNKSDRAANKKIGMNTGTKKGFSSSGDGAVEARLEGVLMKQIKKSGPSQFAFLDMNDNLTIADQKKVRIIANNIDHILYSDQRFIAAKSKSRDVAFFIIQNKRVKEIRFKNSHNVKSIVVNGRDEMTVIDGESIFTSPETVDAILGLKAPRDLPKRYMLADTKLTASRAFFGPDGLFLVSEVGVLMFVGSKGSLSSIPGRVAQMSNSAIGQLWAVNHTGQIFFFDKGKWNKINGLAKSISARGRNVIIVNDKNQVQFYSWKSKKFKSTGLKGAEKIVVQNQSTFWIIREKGSLFRCTKGAKCNRIAIKAKNISIAGDGTIFVLDDKQNLHRLDQNKFERVLLNVKSLREVIAISTTNLLVLNESSQLYATKKFTIGNSIKAGFASIFEKVRFTPNAMRVGGEMLLYGKKFKPNKIKKSAYAPNGGFRFKRDYKQRLITNSVYFLDFSMGKDGRLWAVSASDVFQFHEKTQQFKRYDSINFGRREQKFLGLPPAVAISSITSDHEGKIWAARNNSTYIYYQERLKGRFKQAKLPSVRGAGNITDITIDADGTVYVAAGEIYKWESNKRRFKPYTRGGGPYVRVSSGPAGSLWAVDARDQAFEWVGGRKEKRPNPGKFNIQDIDISVEGIVYATTKTQRSGPNEPGNGVVVSPPSNIECELAIYQADRKRFKKVHRKGTHYAQFVAVAADGTPWTTSAPCGSNNVIRADQ